MLNHIDKNIKSIITSDWKFHFSKLEIIKPLELFQVYDCFLYGIELDILRGNTYYRTYFKLVSLFNTPYKVDFNKYVLSQFVLNKRDLPFDIPIAHHKNIYKDALIATELQAPFDLFVPITKEKIINVLEKNIFKSEYQSIIDLPFRECEFLIQFAALYLEKKRSAKIFEKYIKELQQLPEERMNYFVGDKKQWLNKLVNECKNPNILHDNCQMNILLNKLNKKSGTHLID